jgi:MOSC domain-containing protein YiiM
VRTAGSGVAEHSIHFAGHGGNHQAVYAYAREDLDSWAEESGRPLGDGVFGKNVRHPRSRFVKLRA